MNTRLSLGIIGYAVWFAVAFPFLALGVLCEGEWYRESRVS